MTGSTIVIRSYLDRSITIHKAIPKMISTRMSAFSYLNIVFLLSCLLLICGFSGRLSEAKQSSDLKLPPPPPENDVDAKDKPDNCEACKLLVKSFDIGLDKTNRGKHEGGDTHWEEKNLKSYTDSEVRLVEIQEELCDDVEHGKAQCLAIAEESEQDIEDWWFKHQGSFGPTCQPCPAHKCHGHGTCDGSGTRTGTGECICSIGYSGTECDQCDEGYYKIQTNHEREDQQHQLSCLPCHKACLNGCNGPASANCTECRPGYRRDSETNNCNDINECELGPNEIDFEARKLCPDGTYCVNTDGYYKCADCHRACATCVAYGPDKCLTCAPEFFHDEDHNCIVTRKSPDYNPHRGDDETHLDYLLRMLFSPHMIIMLIIFYLINRVLNNLLTRVNIVQSTRPYWKISIAWVSILICRYLDQHVHWLIVTNFGRNQEMVARLASQTQSSPSSSSSSPSSIGHLEEL